MLLTIHPQRVGCRRRDSHEPLPAFVYASLDAGCGRNMDHRALGTVILPET